MQVQIQVRITTLSVAIFHDVVYDVGVRFDAATGCMVHCEHNVWTTQAAANAGRQFNLTRGENVAEVRLECP